MMLSFLARVGFLFSHSLAMQFNSDKVLPRSIIYILMTTILCEVLFVFFLLVSCRLGADHSFFK